MNLLTMLFGIDKTGNILYKLMRKIGPADPQMIAYRLVTEHPDSIPEGHDAQPIVEAYLDLLVHEGRARIDGIDYEVVR